ncbi:MAG: BlaI/MecI/CopY family transcriptional regulator [candidate division Zixibacteria bacterium]|nr:BlaI/MecI/CopY family transcriptional regulator [candidate division Zixibacteria bacterium]MDH3936956.1 BlaI/MecI/CopY family transcriptional regulator [candidate division Zixibacteria bacterium]MDH4033451.1 BlaI/MecI/CopY family transcriptional regulator [candidate division Zixibacteria bacterium]
MARKKAPTLTEAELKIMSLVWEQGEATVSGVIQAMPKEKRPAYNTVLTIMRILETKGYLRHVKEGRAHVYRPIVSQNQARSKAVRHIVASFFDNSPEQLLLSILENEKLSPAEIARLQQMIASNKQA